MVGRSGSAGPGRLLLVGGGVMATYQVDEGQPYPAMRSGDTWEFTGGRFPGLLVRSVKDLTFRLAVGAPACLFLPVRVPGEDSAWCRVMDGCDGTTLDGLTGLPATHGVRATNCERLRILRVTSCGNALEGIIVGLCQAVEIGWCVTSDNGKGDQSQDRAHGVYVSEKSHRAWVHDLESHSNTGSGVQINGTPEIGGVSLEPRVERAQLTENGGDRTNTPNLSLIAVVNGEFGGVDTAGGRGGLRMFTYGGGASCSGNAFAACTFYEEQAQFSAEFLDGTVDTTFDAACVVRGPEWFADESSELPRWV